MDVLNGALTSGAVIQQLAYSGAAKHQWKLVRTPDGYFAIVNRNSTMCIDIQGSSTADGATIDQAVYDYTANQQWQLVAQTSAVEVPVSGGGNAGSFTVTVITKHKSMFPVVFSGELVKGAECIITDLNGRKIGGLILDGSTEKSVFPLHVDII